MHLLQDITRQRFMFYKVNALRVFYCKSKLGNVVHYKSSAKARNFII